MAEFTLDTSEFDYVLDRLSKLAGEEQLQVFEAVADQVGAELDGIVRAQLPPSPRPQSQSQYWTPKQKRWWWATMHAKASGKSRKLPGWKAQYKRIGGVKKLVLSGSYKRTGAGLRKLSYDTQRRGGNEVILRYGTPIKYMRYVIDEENQAEYHEGNWHTLQEIIDNNMDILSEVAGEEMHKRVIAGLQ